MPCPSQLASDAPAGRVGADRESRRARQVGAKLIASSDDGRLRIEVTTTTRCRHSSSTARRRRRVRSAYRRGGTRRTSVSEIGSRRSMTRWPDIIPVLLGHPQAPRTLGAWRRAHSAPTARGCRGSRASFNGRSDSRRIRLIRSVSAVQAFVRSCEETGSAFVQVAETVHDLGRHPQLSSRITAKQPGVERDPGEHLPRARLA